MNAKLKLLSRLIPCSCHRPRRRVAEGYRVAVVGNPNVGKSTLFTSLTREIAHIANWPGTTVERKEGVMRVKGKEIVLVDLPGIYTLSGTSAEERVARDYLLKGDWDAVLVLVDSLAPERTLYLAIHVLEVTRRAVVALTKWDAAHKHGVHLHVDKLEAALGVPVVPVSAVTGEGLRELAAALLRALEDGKDSPLRVDYGQLEPLIEELEREVAKLHVPTRAPPRWIALKLLEGDEYVAELVANAGGMEVVRKAAELREALSKSVGADVEELVITARFRFVDDLSRLVVVRRKVREEEGVLERLLLSPAGPALSLSILFLLYAAVFAVNTGFPFTVLLEVLGMGELAELLESYTLAGMISSAFDYVAAMIESSGMPEPARSVLAGGIIPGLALVLSFLPLVFTVLLALSFLEDSGLGPYAAASLHRFFQKMGLSGRASYSLLIGLGCNVPAVMSSRAVPEDVERKQLIAAVPFVPCQARLVVIMAFISAYFASPLAAAAVLLITYGVALTLFAVTSLIARRFQGVREPSELLLELPPLHTPSLKVLWWIAWDYTKHYLKRAGWIIFALSVVIWIVTGGGYALTVGRFIAPALAPLGLAGDQAALMGFALIAGFVAKEAVVLSIAAAAGDDPIAALRSLQLSSAQVVALLVFLTAYIPCLATVATMYRESGSIKFTLIAVLWSLFTALLASYIVYWIFLLAGF